MTHLKFEFFFNEKGCTLCLAVLVIAFMFVLIEFEKQEANTFDSEIFGP